MPDRTTRGERVYNAIREDILAGHLAPGSKLGARDLCVRYGASVGGIREALTRLVEQGLVRSKPRQGFSVVPLSLDDLREITIARCEIEGLVLRYAVRDGSLLWESELIAAHHMLAATPQVETSNSDAFSDQWSEVHARFHAAAIAGCSNSCLRGIAVSLRDSAELYTRWSRSIGGAHDRDIGAEHQAILDALLSRDEEAAADSVAAHIQNTSRILGVSLEESRSKFSITKVPELPPSDGVR